jgi:hypothetical protein
MKAFAASFSAVLLAAFALSVQATPSEQQQIEIDHCTIMSKAVLAFGKARDQGQAKMDAYNSVTNGQPYKAGSMVDQTLQWAYDHADENAEAASAHFYGHCSLDALEALTPQTEAQAKSLAAVCQEQNEARPEETRICMDGRISALIVAANTPPNAPAATTFAAPMPAQSQAQTLAATRLPSSTAKPVRVPTAPQPAAPAPVTEVAQAPMPIPAPVRAKPAVPAAAPAVQVAQAPAAASAPMFPALPAPSVTETPKAAPAPAPVAVAKTTAPAPSFPALPAPNVTSTPKAAPAPAPVIAKVSPPPIFPPLPQPMVTDTKPTTTPAVAVAQAPTPVLPPPPVVAPAPTPTRVVEAQPESVVTAPVAAAIAVAQAPAPVTPPTQAPVAVKAPGTASSTSAYVVKAPAPAPATTSAQPALAVLSPASIGNVGKLTLGMAMSDAMHTFHSYGDEDEDEFGAETQTFLISDGHGYVVLLTQKGKPDTLYGIEYHGGADADTSPTIMGVRLGQGALAVLTHVGEPSRRERLPNSENTRWYYDGRNYAFDISSGGDLVAIRLYGYEGLQAPDADSDTAAPAPVTP